MGHHVVADRGHFLYSGGEWTKNSTFGEICQTYLNRLHELKSYVTVVFNGYDATSSSTKTHEQQRRAKGSASKSYLFDENMKLQVKKNAFLSNYDNKNRLITMLKHLLVSHNINVVQAEADADYLVANTCLDLSVNNSL